MIRGALRRMLAVDLIATGILVVAGLAFALLGASEYPLPVLLVALSVYLGVYRWRYGRL